MVETFSTLLDLFKENGALTIYSVIITAYSAIITRRHFQQQDRANAAADKIEAQRDELMQRAFAAAQPQPQAPTLVTPKEEAK